MTWYAGVMAKCLLCSTYVDYERHRRKGGVYGGIECCAYALPLILRVHRPLSLRFFPVRTFIYGVAYKTAQISLKRTNSVLKLTLLIVSIVSAAIFAALSVRCELWLRQLLFAHDFLLQELPWISKPHSSHAQVASDSLQSKNSCSDVFGD